MFGEPGWHALAEKRARVVYDGTPRPAYWTLAAASGRTAAARAAFGL